MTLLDLTPRATVPDRTYPLLVMAAATQVQLTLPATGVCSTRISGGDSCCS